MFEFEQEWLIKINYQPDSTPIISGIYMCGGLRSRREYSYPSIKIIGIPS